MKLTREDGGTAEEDPDVRVVMFVSDAGEYAVPVRATKVRRRAERGDGVLFGADVLHEYVCHVVVLDLGSQVYVDFDAVLHILLFDRVQERVEPLGGAKVADHPCKVDLCVQVFFCHSRAGADMGRNGLPWRGVSAWSC